MLWRMGLNSYFREFQTYASRIDDAQAKTFGITPEVLRGIKFPQRFRAPWGLTDVEWAFVESTCRARPPSSSFQPRGLIFGKARELGRHGNDICTVPVVRVEKSREWRFLLCVKFR